MLEIRKCLGALAVTAGMLVVRTANAAPEKLVLPSAFSNGFVYVKVSINGAPAVWMDIDDGTSPSVIDFDYAQKLGLKLKDAGKLGEGVGNAPAQLFTTRVAKLTSGPVSQSDVEFEAAKLTVTGMTGPDGQPLAGIVGYSFLKGRVVVLDYKANEVDFLTQKPTACICDLPMKLDNDVPAIEVSVAGHPVTALIDSGGQYNLLLTPATAQAIGVGDTMTAATPATGYGYNGAQNVRIGTAPSLAVGTISLANPATMYSTFGNAPLKAGGSLGVQFLRHYRVTLNYPASTVRFDP